ncbi:MAG: hypothetical protein EBS54_00250 [Betaproteobacteria bacterium]|nr:hypothetical protein [Betaproteobacteria bacterium]NBT05224.1 hypothetical protein [Betaproteobacteria bacterium]NCY07555.1 hypothetical protein [Betaproteobacteria bacterium]NDE53043.1 hypothetical protein [Actinomycetota bacterium]
MSGLTTVNIIGLAGLRTAQSGMTATSNNVAGAAVEGFHRREVHPMITSPTSDPLLQGGSVVVDSVVRSFSALITQQYLTNNSKLKQAENLTSSSAIVDKMVLDEAEGLTKVLNGFFTAASDLSADPASATARTAFATSSRETADRIRNLAETIDETRKQAYLEMERVVGVANEKALALSRVNQLIQSSQAFGKPLPAPDLLDERDRIAAEIAGLVGADVRISDKGEGMIRFGGLSFVDGTQAFQIEVMRDTSGKPTGVLRVTQSQLKDSIVFGSAKGGTDALGEFGGLSRYVEGASDWLGRLDRLVVGDPDKGIAGLMTATSPAQGNSWVDKRGEPVESMFEVSPSDIPGEKALSVRSTMESGLSIPWASESDESEPPHESIGIQIVAQRTAVLQSWSDWVTSVSSDISDWRAEEASYGAVDTALNEKRQQIAGVDLDEEATNLLRFQQLYQASSSVMQAAMKMFDVLIGATTSR